MSADTSAAGVAESPMTVDLAEIRDHAVADCDRADATIAYCGLLPVDAERLSRAVAVARAAAVSQYARHAYDYPPPGISHYELRARQDAACDAEQTLRFAVRALGGRPPMQL